jgi:hypothetical protein
VEESHGIENTTLPSLLRETALFLWEDWPRDMRAILKNAQNRQFTMAGVCPHCNHDSAFILSTSICGNDTPGIQRWIAGMQCQACMKFILAVTIFKSGALIYEEHYPLGMPNDNVDPEIPTHIQPDFKEALRCLWVNAYNATAEMCRRAIEASCLDLGAPKKDVLEDMIDWLAEKQIITPFLQKVAHKIRLGGNRGAHPAADGAQAKDLAEDAAGPILVIEKDHAEAIVKFTRDFFQYVYVIPKQLDKYDFSKPKVKP